jgi:SAM-dependent methyltransferase
VSVDPLAAEGFTESAAAYERGRPGYPAAALDWLVGEFGLGVESRVLDLGAGTGKLTRGLVGRVGSVVAVEPLDAMREWLSRVVASAEAVSGFAEALPLEAASVDAVFSGEAFHWFSLEPALAEIRRVLRPGGAGGLAVLWNVPKWDVPWAHEFGEALERHRDTREHPWMNRKPWTFGEGMDDREDWTPVRTEHFVNEQRFTAAEILDNVASISFIGALPPDARAAALADVAAILARHEVDDAVLRWRCDAHVTRPVVSS